MFNPWFWFGFAFGGWVLLTSSCNSASEVQPSRDRERIAEIMDAQEDAWNRGDLEGFMKAYWPSDELVFIGKSGVQKGYASTLRNYQRSYPNKERMGTLQFENLMMNGVGADHYSVIGAWTLYRTEDTLKGHYSLLWRRIAGEWLIVSDHSS